MRIKLSYALWLISLMVLLFAASACKKENDGNSSINPYNGKSKAAFNPAITYGTMTDIEGNIYKTVTIGTQTWMAENLRTTKYNDSTNIPYAINNSEWAALLSASYSNYDHTTNAETIATYGRLYNWYAVNTGKLAPKGWHIPSNKE